jgi:predicted transcriptional regulator
MPESIREMATRIVSAYASQNPMTQAELFDLMDSVVNKLTKVKDTEEQRPTRNSGWTQKQASHDAVDPRASIGQDKVICLECRREFKMLNERHLIKEHGMTRAEYLAKHGLSSRESLVSKTLSEKRRKSALERGLGKKGKGDVAPE